MVMTSSKGSRSTLEGTHALRPCEDASLVLARLRAHLYTDTCVVPIFLDWALVSFGHTPAA
eukprot:4707755-Pyramimonas_sp.AAC.1